MREIRFREKRNDNGEWVYGHLIAQDTVGQGICIDDNWYFEGDIFWDGDNEEYCVLVFDDTRFAFEYDGEIVCVESMYDMELCGNVWDNPELVGWYSHDS